MNVWGGGRHTTCFLRFIYWMSYRQNDLKGGSHWIEYYWSHLAEDVPLLLLLVIVTERSLYCDSLRLTWLFVAVIPFGGRSGEILYSLFSPFDICFSLSTKRTESQGWFPFDLVALYWSDQKSQKKVQDFLSCTFFLFLYLND